MYTTHSVHIHKAIYTCNKRDTIDVDIYNIILFLLHCPLLDGTHSIDKNTGKQK